VKTVALALGCLTSLLLPFHQQNPTKPFELQAGGIIRTDRSQKEIHLVFTGHEFADGGQHVRGVLGRHNIKASFFFTGDFYRNPQFAPLITSLRKEGHYLGGHSDKHLLYCTWEKRDSLLVSRDSFQLDLKDNYREMKRFGIAQPEARYFLPPFEWYNDSIAAWTKQLGLTLINFTPGTYSNADWTHPELGSQYLGSDSIFARILRYESAKPDGLNGFLLLTHIGTDPRRKDKFYLRLERLITELQLKGYRFTLLDAPIP
jgi:endoglucanase